ncbi:MAG: serine hydrolase domain-containing protein [Gemmatimonadota bacterium]
MPRLDRALEILEEGVAQGHYLGAQAYVSRHGQGAAEVAVGEARPGVPMTTDTLTLWLSSCKPITALAVARLWERGLLDLDRPVGQLLPEFGRRGKEGVTVRHVLTHTGGFRSLVDLGHLGTTWEESMARVYQARQEAGWAPGRRAGYHIMSGWFVLGELVQRLTGQVFAEHVRHELLLPAGMLDTWLALSPDQQARCGERLAGLYDTTGPQALPRRSWMGESGLARCVPGASGRGPARDLGRRDEMLLAQGTAPGGRLLSAATVEALTARHRVGLVDETFGARLDWGLGFLIDSKHYREAGPYGYGPHASPRTFGHSGNQSSTAYADPEHGLVVAVVTNGMPGPEPHQARFDRLNRAIYGDLGLAAPS